MKDKKIIKIYKNYTFVNYTTYNYYGFKEHSDLYINNYCLTSQSIQYYNRSWQVYEYQSSMRKSINTLIESLKKDLKEEYKQINNIKRITKEKEKDLKEYFKTSKVLKEYKEILKRINKNIY